MNPIRLISPRTLALFLLSLGLIGCAAIPQKMEPVGTTARGTPILAGRHGSSAHTDIAYEHYNGRTRTVQGQPVPYLSRALFDYPAHMVAWIIEHGDQLDRGGAVGGVIAAPRSWQGDALRTFAGTDAVLRLLGLGGAASMGWGQIGLSLLFSGLNEESFYRDAGLLAAREIAGSTLTLIRVRAASSNEGEELTALRNQDEIISGVLKGVSNQNVRYLAVYHTPSPYSSSIEAEIPLSVSEPTAGIPLFYGTMGIVSRVAIKARSWPLAPIPRHPLHRLQPQGVLEVIAFRDIAYHARTDGIRSPKALYERVVGPGLSEDWYVVYTDTDPEDGVRRVFVQRHRKDRTQAKVVKFDIPPSPFR